MVRTTSSSAALPRLVCCCLLPLIPLYLIAQHLNVHNPAAPFFFVQHSSLYGDAFTSPHSDQRISTATDFIESYLNRSDGLTDKKNQIEYKSGSDFKISVGIVSVNRPEGAQYLDACLGSILEGMHSSERDQIHLTTFLADLNPADHSAFEERWLWDLNDEIIVRREPKSELDLGENNQNIVDQDQKYRRKRVEKLKVQQLPNELTTRLRAKAESSQRKSKTSPWHHKETLDYTTILSSCLHSNDKFCLILEDDVILKRGWFGILERYVEEAERLDEQQGKGSGFDFELSSSGSTITGNVNMKTNLKPWVFLRLFYAEKYFGWEDYEVPEIIRQAVLYWVASLLALSLLRSSLISKATGKPNEGLSEDSESIESSKASLSSRSTFRFSSIFRRLSKLSILSLSLTILPYYGLLILSGRNNHPSHSIRYGLSTMNERGCCTQALLFKTSLVPGIIDYLEREENFTRRPKDLLAIEYALYGNMKDTNVGHVSQNQRQDAKSDSEITPDFEGGKILAMRPMLAQHIGHSSSRNKGFKRKSRVWGFGFEREWDPKDW